MTKEERDKWEKMNKRKLIWVGDCDHDLDQAGWVDPETGRKPKKTDE